MKKRYLLLFLFLTGCGKGNEGILTPKYCVNSPTGQVCCKEKTVELNGQANLYDCDNGSSVLNATNIVILNKL